MNGVRAYLLPHHHRHQRYRDNNNEDGEMRNGYVRNGSGGGRRDSASADVLPKAVLFDESNDDYRCLCNCLHVKTATYCVAVTEAFFILFYFLHSVLVLFQQTDSHHSSNALHSSADTWVFCSFVACNVGLALATLTLLIMLVGVTRNQSILLFPHIFVQGISIVCFALLLVSGAIAITTNTTIFYRLLHAAPFDEYPQTSTVALDSETMARIYALLIIYAISLLLECWFVVVCINCERYLRERRAYMRYCLAFSTPLKTLSSAR